MHVTWRREVVTGAEQARAAQIIVEAVDKPRNIQFKGETDLVTETDKASEEAILKVSALPSSPSDP